MIGSNQWQFWTLSKRGAIGRKVPKNFLAPPSQTNAPPVLKSINLVKSLTIEIVLNEITPLSNTLLYWCALVISVPITINKTLTKPFQLVY